MSSSSRGCFADTFAYTPHHVPPNSGYLNVHAFRHPVSVRDAYPAGGTEYRPILERPSRSLLIQSNNQQCISDASYLDITMQLYPSRRGVSSRDKWNMYWIEETSLRVEAFIMKHRRPPTKLRERDPMSSTALLASAWDYLITQPSSTSSIPFSAWCIPTRWISRFSMAMSSIV
ncbi:hypothetical protein P153DRAFT_391415 [Dothidotthia symphoricarpi CBS 119687]|uniref:Uncharacterized protein n=1 Tax=Dothidotthia symphoricarpi CBS 119687 TaxID=1392245 RepID=A0A6A5ZYU5_9PLEO|nr:uncharacterized protein P153DRAFT_391415 [Dothidotthia symphoricarpi CBS 119687]KAF2123578.1 hypothetical protein P153DRAFT_391415 [Dothidotthia symphoricarpi CBS 119687]